MEGEPLNEADPDAEVRTLTFGAHHEGMVTYLIPGRSAAGGCIERALAGLSTRSSRCRDDIQPYA